MRAGEGVDAIEDSFDIDDYTRWRLLEGLDDIGITLGHEDDIAAFEANSSELEAGHAPRRLTPALFRRKAANPLSCLGILGLLLASLVH